MTADARQLKARRCPKLLFAAAALGALVLLALPVAASAAATEVTAAPAASAVRYTTAHLSAELDPKDHETSFYFEWVSQAQFEAEGFAAAEANGQLAGF